MEKREGFIRVGQGFFKEPIMAKIRHMDDGDKCLIVYLEMLLLASKSKWVIRYDHLEDDVVSEIALDLDEPVGIVRNVLSLLEKEEMAEIGVETVTIHQPTHHRYRTGADYKNWRKSVFERDSYTCKKCGRHGCTLEAHHIKPWAEYPELRFDVSNGITLCTKCHREFHAKGDVANG